VRRSETTGARAPLCLPEDAGKNVPRMDQVIGKNESFTDRLKAVQASKAPPVQPPEPPDRGGQSG
jgi:hypothetical protein